MNIAILIPAFEPGRPLIDLVAQLAAQPVAAILIVDDGSGSGYAACFEEVERFPGVTVIHHAGNQGKGAALKTGIEFAIRSFPDCLGVVTADADGQHAADDILKVARRLLEYPNRLILGTREFSAGVPWRSRVGNRLTRAVVRLMLGELISDTQTGLRGIPHPLLSKLLPIPSNGYEFELDMLIAASSAGIAVLEEPVRTIYLDANRSSHFNPLLDSMRIYFVLFRFTVLSLMTAALDNLVFYLVFRATGNILDSQIVGRMVAMTFQYTSARSAVFASDERHRIALPKYLLLVASNGALTYGLIQYLHSVWGVGVIPAKVMAESALFVGSFAIQRKFVFIRRGPPALDSSLQLCPPVSPAFPDDRN